jgi:hypothetical protein
MRPTPEQVAAAYPERARELSVGGPVEVECTVGLHGLLHCNGVGVPNWLSGLGFDAAARSLMQYYRLAEFDVGGSPTVGRPIYVTVEFDPP